MRVAALLVVLLAGCSPGGPNRQADAGTTLEEAAIARGVVRDPASTAITGLYAREGDRLCLVEQDSSARVGMFIDYGDGIGCSARGTAERAGDRLAIDLGQRCRFDAGFDGDRIRFPGALPGSCARLCTRRASLAGLALDRLSESRSEAQALRDPRGTALCG
ncbi:hypothetical protein [Sphingomonas sp. VNH70]|uniref:hypothetical protein n=1 Tax=Sphingomonas silueang TaxID=3156617 RepID=UPI0032B48BBC